MKTNAPVRLLLWILASWGFFAAIAALTSFPLLHWFPMLFLGLCIFIFQEKPLSQRGFSENVEFSAASICGLIFFAYFTWAVVAPLLQAEERANTACNPKTLESRCYTFSNDNCKSLWTHFENECREEIKKTISSQKATLLVGPYVRRCTYKRLDQSFKANRRTLMDPDCVAHFNSMDSQSD